MIGFIKNNTKNQLTLHPLYIRFCFRIHKNGRMLKNHKSKFCCDDTNYVVLVVIIMFNCII
jgi:hypothetical protein